MRVLFRVLSDFGEPDLAFKLITRSDYPSYGNFVERGLTALPEDFLREEDTPIRRITICTATFPHGSSNISAAYE